MELKNAAKKKKKYAHTKHREQDKEKQEAPSRAPWLEK